MDTSTQIFFIISSVGFVLLWILAGIFLFYLVKAVKTFSRIMEKLESDINAIGDTTVDLIEEIKDSTIFNFLFKRKRNKKNASKSK